MLECNCTFAPAFKGSVLKSKQPEKKVKKTCWLFEN